MVIRQLGRYENPSFFGMRNGEQLNEAIAGLPIAKNEKLTDELGKELEDYKGIRVTTKAGQTSIVNVPSKRYLVVQHSEAFRPIIEGMTTAGQKDFKFILYSDFRKAELQIYTQDPLYDGVQLGFSVRNSFDGSQALQYGIKAYSQKHEIELVGYRQICGNGLKIRVPLNQAEIIRPEIRTKIQKILEEKARILHTQSAKQKIEAIQYVVEALTLLREPVEILIKKSQKFTIKNEKMLKDLINFHVGKRFESKVRKQYFKEEGRDLWSLFNAMTHTASHDPNLEVSTRERLIDKASDLLLVAVNGMPKEKAI